MDREKNSSGFFCSSGSCAQSLHTPTSIFFLTCVWVGVCVLRMKFVLDLWPLLPLQQVEQKIFLFFAGEGERERERYICVRKRGGVSECTSLFSAPPCATVRYVCDLGCCRSWGAVSTGEKRKKKQESFISVRPHFCAERRRRRRRRKVSKSFFFLPSFPPEEVIAASAAAAAAAAAVARRERGKQ